jgi:ABC-type multidrug transport system fused ATPase/permease subunit
MQIPINQYRELLARYLRPQLLSVSVLTILLFSSIGLQIFNPQILRYFIDTATTTTTRLSVETALYTGPVVTEASLQNSLMLAALLFIGLAVIQQIVAIGAVYMSENVGWTATNMLRADLGLHCLRLDMTFHHVRTPGELIERVDGDVNELANFFSKFTILVMGNVLLLAGIVMAMFFENAAMGIAMTMFALATLWALNRVRNIAIPHWAAARQAHAEFFGYVEEMLSATEDIRSSGGVDYIMRGLYRLLRQRLISQRKAAQMVLLVFAVIIALFTVGLIIAMAAGYLLVTLGGATIGTAFLFINYTQMMFRPLREITNQIQELQRAGAGIGRIDELYNIRSTILDGSGAQIPDGPLAVEFDNVTFAYNEDENILQDFNFKLEPGRVLGLLGRTGSGKTTITRLLFRLYDVQGGAVKLGGVDIRDATLQHLRSRVGVVTQDVQLFRATVRDNLTLFDRSIPDEKIIEALDDLGLTDWYRALPDGLDSEMRSGGNNLSAGEGQLLAFTRVFLKDPGLIILDEASSRLDPVTEQRIERAIDKLFNNRTAIIVAHRLATVQRADEIMVIEQGEIDEHDARERLANDPDSRFYHLLQTGLEEALA